MKSLYLILFYFFSFSFVFGQLSIEQCAVLDMFAKHMIAEHELGYVLEGSKPVCATGYALMNNICPNTHCHKTDIIHKQAFAILNSISRNRNAKFLFSSNYQNQNTNLVETIFINRSRFIEEFDKNKHLFMYILGPSVNADLLLNEVLRTDLGFMETLKDDKILVGILLGFKAENSLYGSRVENLQESLFKIYPPYKPVKIDGLEFLQPAKEMLVMNASNVSFKLSSREMPGIGIKSVDAELASLCDQMDVSSVKLCSNPPYVFGKVKTLEENKAFIECLEAQQEKILNYDQSNMLKFFLESFGIAEEICLGHDYNSFRYTFNRDEKKLLNTVIAEEVWNFIKKKPKTFQKGFLDGFSNEKDQPLNPSMSSCHYELLAKKLEIKNKLEECEKALAELSKNEGMISIIDSKLFYQIIKKGNGPKLTGLPHVEAHYIFTTQDDELFFDTNHEKKPKQLDLEGIIVGMSEGMQGMNTGEIREIYIHPDYGYGIYSVFPKGVYIKVRVELMRIVSKNTSDLIPIGSHDIKKDLTVDEEEFDKQSHMYGFRNGQDLKKHYSLAEECSINEISKILQQLVNGKNMDFPNADISESLINKLHWNIYKSVSSSSSSSPK